MILQIFFWLLVFSKLHHADSQPAPSGFADTGGVIIDPPPDEEMQTAEWDIVLKKDTNNTATNAYNVIKNELHFQKYQPSFMLTKNLEYNTLFCNHGKKHFSVFINLLYARKIYKVLVVTNQDEFDVIVNGMNSVKGKISSIGTRIQTEFVLDGINSQYCEVRLWADIAACIYTIKVFTQVFLLPKANFFHASIQEISYPYEQPAVDISNFQNILSDFHTPNKVRFYDGSLRYLDFYDKTPIVWYTMSFDESMYFYGVVFATKPNHESPDFYFSYQTTEGRKFLEYKEDGKRRVFENIINAFDWNVHHLKDAILAKCVQVYLLGYVADFEIKLNFFGFKSIQFVNPWSTFISSNTFEADDFVDGTIEMALDKSYGIYGLYIDNYKDLQEFCLSYRVLFNGVVVPYKDEPSKEHETIFQMNEPNLYLKPFVTNILTLHCFKYKKISRMTIHVKGRHTSDLVEWYHPANEQTLSHSPVKDQYNNIGLFGTMDSFQKALPEDRLFTHYMGDSCLTRPDTCYDGFTIQFQKKGNFGKPTYDTYISAPYTVLLNGVFPAHPIQLAFPDVGSEIKMIFGNILPYTYAEIVSATISFNIKEWVGNPDGSLYLYLTAIHLAQLKTYALQTSLAYATELQYSISKISDLGVIDITDALKVHLSTKKFEARNLSIWFKPSSNGNFIAYSESIRLKIDARVKVPKSIQKIEVAPTISNKVAVINFNNASIVTSVYIQHAHNLHWSFSFAYTEASVTKNIWLFNGGEPLTKLILEDGKKFVRIDFPYPVILQNLHIHGNYAMTDVIIIPYGTVHTIDRFNQEETFPIFSAGLHGDHQESTGTGVTIYYDKEFRLHAFLHMKIYTFYNSWQMENVPDNKIETFTITAYALKFDLYIDGIKQESETKMATNYSNPVPYQEYILLFGNHYSTFSYGVGNLIRIKLYHIAVETEVTHGITYPTNLLGEDISYERFHKEDQICKSWKCPTADIILGPVDAKFEVGKIKIFDEVDQILIENEMILLSTSNDITNIAFIDVSIPRSQAAIDSIHLALTSYSSVVRSCPIIIKTTGKEVLQRIEPDTTELHIYLTDHLKDYISSSEGEKSQDSFELEFSLNKSLCFDPDKEITHAELNIKYKLEVNRSPRLVAFAHEQYSSKLSIKIRKEALCVTFKYFVGGKGFAYISIVDKSNTGDETEIFHDEKLEKGSEQTIELLLNASAIPTELVFYVIKAGFRTGYFQLNSISQSSSACKNPSEKNLQTKSAETIDGLVHHLSNSRHFRMLFVCSIGNQDSIPMSKSNIQNLDYPKSNDLKSNVTFNGNSYANRAGTMTFRIEEPVHEFTIAFWVFSPDANLNFAYTDGSTNLKLVHVTFTNSKNLKIKICDDKYIEYDSHETTESGWVPVVITMFNSFYRIEINNEVLLTNESYCLEGQPNQLLDFRLKKQKSIYCLQFFRAAFTEVQKKTALICPSIYRLNACSVSLSPSCGWCDQLTKKWHPLKTLDDNCKSKIVQIFLPSYHMQFDKNTFINPVTKNELFQMNESLSIQTGVVTRALVLSSSTFYDSGAVEFSCGVRCTLAMWLQYLCDDLSERKIFQTDFIILQCSEVPEGELPGYVAILTRSCTYRLTVPHGFWYHIVIEIDNNLVVVIYVNGESIGFNEDCSSKMPVNSNIKLGFGSKVKIDELFLKQNELLTADQINVMYGLYTMDASTGDEIAKYTFPIWFQVSADNFNITDENVIVEGMKPNVDLLMKIHNLESQLEAIFDHQNSRIFREGASLVVDAPFYVKRLTEDLLVRSEKAFNDTGFSNAILYQRNSPDDLATLTEMILSKSDLKITPDSYFANLYWEQIYRPENVIVLGVYVDLTLKTNLLNASYILNEKIERIFSNNKHFRLNNLLPYSTYEVQLNLLLTNGETLALPVNFIQEFDTLQAGPISTPNLTCTSSMDKISCHFEDLSKEYWLGELYSYEVACMKTSVQQEYQIASLFNSSLNSTDKDLQKKVILYKVDNNIVEFEAKEIFENFTLEIRATTSNGEKTGISNQTIVRSQIGAPDHAPENFYMKYKNGTVYYHYDRYVDDIAYWNSYIEDRHTWLFELAVTFYLQNDVVIMPPNPANIIQYFHVIHTTFTDVVMTNITAYSNSYPSNTSENVCIILPCEEAPYFRDWRKELKIDVINHHNVTISVSFQKFKWRGQQKYLHVIFYAPSQITPQMVVPEIEANQLRNPDNKEEQTFIVESHLGYWTRVYQYHHYTNNQIESNFTNNSFLCNIEPISSLLNTGNDIVTVTGNFTGLHPYKTYWIALQLCNEIGCNSFTSQYRGITTEQYKPASPPQNLSIAALEGFHMLTNWSTIDSFYVHGEIESFHLNYTIASLNQSGYAEIPGDVFSYVIKDVGKYKEVCFQVAGKTSYPEIGVYSNFSCNYSIEAAPEMFPEIIAGELSSSSLLIELVKPLNIANLNGILRAVLIKYNTSMTSQNTVQYNVTHEDFFNTTHPYILVLEGLLPFTIYSIEAAYVTVATGPFSVPVTEKTNLDSPKHPPWNISIEVGATTINMSWEHLPFDSWNGPPFAYNMTLYEYQLDGNISSKIIKVHPDINNHFERGLHPYREYDISISACTAVGCSNFTTNHFRTNESVPCPPKELERIKSILNKLCMTWFPIPRECVNGVLQAYVIYVKQITIEPSGIEKMFDYEIDSSSTENCVEDIPQGRIYNVSIAGRNGAGIGNKSQVFSTIFGDIIHGNWTLWTEWTPCTRSCGNATKKRERFCSNPTPVHGRPCSGYSNETTHCDLPHCPGFYLPPPGKFDCNHLCKTLGLTCNKIIVTQNRTDIFKEAGLPCINDPGDKRYYKYAHHPSYNIEDKTCEGFVMKSYSIQCSAPENGNTNIQRLCKCKDPSAEGLTEWYPWSPCLKTCSATLRRTRKRECIVKSKCKKNAKLYDEKSCGLKPCPIDGKWGDWLETAECSRVCNKGYRIRVRSCTKPAPDHGGKRCPGPDEDKGKICNPHPCPINGGMSLWSQWGACKSTCGKSKRKRSRFCNNPTPKYKGLPCPNMWEMQETETDCNFEDCQPLDIILTYRILNREWHYTMYQMSSVKARELEKEFCKKVNASLSNSTKLLSCEILSIIKGPVYEGMSRGTVVTSANLRFEKVNSEQVVRFIDDLLMNGYIGDLNVDSISVNITSIPYKPIDDISVKLFEQISANISWTLPQKHVENTHIYIMYIENEETDKNTKWYIEGVASSSTYMFLYYLKPYQLYRAYVVRSNSLGHGIPSRQFFIKVNASKPATYPFNVDGFAMTSSSIYVKWNDIPKIYQNGLLRGYLVKYRKLDDKSFQTRFVEYGFFTLTITGLEAYTYYQIDVSGVNAGGEGPADYVMIETLEGAPSVPVPGVNIYDMQSISWWSVSWSPIPKDKIHGVLQGYRLKYYMSYRSDVPIGGEIKWIVKTFDQFTFYHEQRKLDNYATYNVTVTAFTNAGEGPTPEYFAKTCKCKKLLFGNWYVLNPYTEFKPPSNLTGLFPDLVREAIIGACGGCKNYRQSTLHLLKTKEGYNPNKFSALNLKLSINDDVDVSFPYYENMDTVSVVPGSVFVPLIKSGGCAFIIRNEVNIGELVLNLILKVVKVWPLLVVSYAIAGLCGFFVWFTDQFMNPEEFVLGSSIRGPCIGFWFSFVTMTTVGYGDLAPRSKTARLISIVWFLVGLILNGIIIGFITTATTSLDQPETAKLYNTKTATLNQSYEYRLAVRRNARVTDKAYSTIDSMLDDLQEKNVDAVLIDLYSLVGYTEALQSRYLKIKGIIDTNTAYGIILSGLSVHLKKDVESSMYSQNDVLTTFIKSIEKDIPSLSEEKAGDVMQLVFGEKSQIFKDTAIMMSLILAGFCVIGILYEMIRVVRSRQKVDALKERCIQCEGLEKIVEEFVENVMLKIRMKSNEEDKDLIYLATLTNAIKRYESKIGKDATMAKIRWLWDSVA